MRLPNFLIIGAPKAATTSLYHYLGQHPDVYVSPIKETNYFWYEGQREKRFSVTTRGEYEQLFAGVTTETAIGEASPQYLNSPTAAERIARDLPGVRLIASLRNPVDRAYSAYLGRLRNGRTSRSLGEALRPGTDFFEHSLYHPRLKRYIDRFPRSSIKVILFEEFAEHSCEVTQELFEFLGVNRRFTPDTGLAHNRTAVPKSVGFNQLLLAALSLRIPLLPFLPAFARGSGVSARLHRATLVRASPLPEDLRMDLLRQFKDDIRRTGDLIGRDLSDWLAPLSP
jgi:hypothetical protein